MSRHNQLRNQNSKRWMFTINNPDESIEQQLENLKEQSDYLIYQKEVGEEGTPHYQGRKE